MADAATGSPFSGNISGGYGRSTSRTERAPLEFAQQPEFPEAEGARGAWWEKLQQFGGDPDYGAISPDWADIWENAQKKVRQYFWGSPTDPGLVGKVKASAARRGVSESPAMEGAISRMGATESNVISDMATQEAQSRAEFAEGGRQSYLQNLMQLSNVRTQGQFWTPWEQTKSSQWDVSGKAAIG